MFFQYRVRAVTPNNKNDLILMKHVEGKGHKLLQTLNSNPAEAGDPDG